MATKTKKTAAETEIKWPYGTKNYIWFAAALVVILVGFFTLSKGSITLAPILLVVGYCVLLPIALIIKGRSDEDETPKPAE